MALVLVWLLFLGRQGLERPYEQVRGKDKREVISYENKTMESVLSP